jgi:hypothetical protein
VIDWLIITPKDSHKPSAEGVRSSTATLPLFFSDAVPPLKLYWSIAYGQIVSILQLEKIPPVFGGDEGLSGRTPGNGFTGKVESAIGIADLPTPALVSTGDVGTEVAAFGYLALLR